MTKKTAKKKPAAKKAAKKAAKVMSDVMDSIIETVAVEPMITSSPHEMEVFDEDDYNPYAPQNNAGGWNEELEPGPEAIIMPPDKPEPQPTPVEAPSSPLPAPVKHVATPAVAPSPTSTPDALTGDALVVQRLINAVNHMYPVARTVKGQKGLQPDAVKKIADNIVLARQLVTRLS